MASPSANNIPLFLLIIILIIPNPTTADSFKGRITNDPDAITRASNDYGNIVHRKPTSVLYPSSVNDIIDLIRSSNALPTPFKISARGTGHSIRGQAMAPNGVVVEMSSLRSSYNGTTPGGVKIGGSSSSGFYADVGGEQLWIDVLNATLEEGLSPVSWTDYLYLSVGGTLSNAGLSGQAFLHGPQTSNVLELDVVTGKGEFITCSRNRSTELFYGVLGGLGQFGIITRARIVLDKAPPRAKRIRMLYSDFTEFSTDQEYLITSDVPSYLEGFLITNENRLREWLNVSSSDKQLDLVALLKQNRILYYIELVKYYDDQTAGAVDNDIKKLLQHLNYLPGYVTDNNSTLYEFLTRVKYLGDPQRQTDSHPWLNIFIPQSRINDFYDKVMSIVIPKFNDTFPIFIMYPLNRNKWDDRMSMVIINEDVFYVLGLLHTSGPDGYQVFDDLNNEILARCRSSGIVVKHFLPAYIKTYWAWIAQYQGKWIKMRRNKIMFDPNLILAPGQGIFNTL